MTQVASTHRVAEVKRRCADQQVRERNCVAALTSLRIELSGTLRHFSGEGLHCNSRKEAIQILSPPAELSGCPGAPQAMLQFHNAHGGQHNFSLFVIAGKRLQKGCHWLRVSFGGDQHARVEKLVPCWRTQRLAVCLDGGAHVRREVRIGRRSIA
jgi:hypothetical protein